MSPVNASVIDVVIVNWNAGQQLRDCLVSLQGSHRSRVQLGSVVVVDNASTDASLDGLEALDLPLQVIRNETNRGFGAACNQGARAGSGDLVLFLNPDAAVYPDTLPEAARFMAEHPRAGVCGVALEGSDGTVHRSCCDLPTPKTMLVKSLGLDKASAGRLAGYSLERWPHDETRRVDHVIGAFYLMRRTLFESLGGFDERFFVYLEDLDLSARAKAAGWETWFLRDPRAFHKGGGTSERAKPVRLFYSLRSRLQYVSKHFGGASSAAVWVATLTAEPVIRLAFACARGRLSQVAEVFGGYRRLLGWVVSPSARQGGDTTSLPRC
jgi:GT2 family glycosyltransferase